MKTINVFSGGVIERVLDLALRSLVLADVFNKVCIP
jgi:hypothetical protein